MSAIQFDLLLQLFVLSRHCRVEVNLARLIDSSPLQKFGVFRFDDQIIRLNIGSERHFGADFGDVSLNRINAQLFSNRDSVMPIFNKIDVAELVDFDRRQPLSSHIRHRRHHVRPTRFVAVVSRQKAAREVGITPHAADDLFNWNLFQAAMRAANGFKFLRDLFVRKKLGGLAREARNDSLNRRFASRVAKIFAGRTVTFDVI